MFWVQGPGSGRARHIGGVDQWEEISMSIDQSEASITWPQASPSWPPPPPGCPAPGRAPSPGPRASWWPMRRQYRHRQSHPQWEANITWWAAPWSPPAPAWSGSPETSAARRRSASDPGWPGHSWPSWGMMRLTSLCDDCSIFSMLCSPSDFYQTHRPALFCFSPQVTRAGQV